MLYLLVVNNFKVTSTIFNTIQVLILNYNPLDSNFLQFQLLYSYIKKLKILIHK